MASGPSRDQFHTLAARYPVVPVWREVLADLTTPVAGFLRVVGDEPGFLLESVEHERWGRWSFFGRRPRATLVARGNHVEVEGDLPLDVPRDRGILAAVETVLDGYRSPPLPDLPPLHGGLVGYLGYDVVREVERLPDVPPDDAGCPDAVLSVIGDIVAYDHFRQRVTLVANALIAPGSDDPTIDHAYDDAVARLDQLAADGARALDEPLVEPPDPDDPLPEVRSSMGPVAYRDAVEVAREYILAGDIFQVVLAQRFDLDLDADAFDVYRVLRQVNPSPYMYFFHHPSVTLIGSSPEPMVQLLDGRVISRPIAGTRRRGRTDADDRRLAAELREHPKELAEHVMLVDLARNDVGRVVTFGTERVDELMTLERYSHVMHLTSQVSGDLAEGRTAIDVLRATLPAGTVSGAPKVRAMEIIDELEPLKRGPYAGVVGYIDFSGNLDTAIAIRTMVVLPDGRASVEAGAGIVVDSVAEHEDLECHNKAQALLAAVPAARRMTAARRRPAAASEVVAAPLVRDGIAVEGPEAESYLQGQLSQDVAALAPGASAWSLLLEPTGKVSAWLRVTRTGPERFLLDVDEGAGAAVVARLERFKLRTRCTVSEVPGPRVAVRGPGSAALPVPAERRMPIAWPGVEGFDLLDEEPGDLEGIGRVAAAELDALRIEAGVPRTGVELTDRTIPAEAGQWLIDASVSFTKGCYTGQELVARVDSRGGNVPRHLRAVVVDGPDAPGAGARLHTGGDGERAVGELTSVAWSAGRNAFVGLAFVGRAVEPPADVTVVWDGGRARGRVLATPLP